MKYYALRFGTGDPRTFTGLAPTLLIFTRMLDGQTIAPPAITETLTGSGLYQFAWGTTQSIAFLADAATISPGVYGRYVAGVIDPADRADEFGSTLNALGLTAIALGTTGVALGTTSVALGTTAVALGTTGVALGTSNIALGTTNVAIGTTILAMNTTIIVTVVGIGSTTSSYGTESSDPVDLFGYMKRILENLEGDETFTKASGALSIYSRGSSTLLAAKTVANNASLVTKTGH